MQNATPIYIIVKQYKFITYCKPYLIYKSLNNNNLL